MAPVLTEFLRSGDSDQSKWCLNLGLFKTVRIEIKGTEFGGNLFTDKKSLDFFNGHKMHPPHRWKRLPPISLPVPS